MGTKGLTCIRYKGKYYKSYNHWDSYPTGLGYQLVEELRKANLIEWELLLEKLIVIDEDKPPTEEDKEALVQYTDLSVNTQSTDDWYCLTRKTQGSFKRLLESGYLLGSVQTTFHNDHEYAYLLDFDNDVFTWFAGDEEQESYQLDAIPEGLFEGDESS